MTDCHPISLICTSAKGSASYVSVGSRFLCQCQRRSMLSNRKKGTLNRAFWLIARSKLIASALRWKKHCDLHKRYRSHRGIQAASFSKCMYEIIRDERPGFSGNHDYQGPRHLRRTICANLSC